MYWSALGPSVRTLWGKLGYATLQPTPEPSHKHFSEKFWKFSKTTSKKNRHFVVYHKGLFLVGNATEHYYHTKICTPGLGTKAVRILIDLVTSTVDRNKYGTRIKLQASFPRPSSVATQLVTTPSQGESNGQCPHPCQQNYRSSSIPATKRAASHPQARPGKPACRWCSQSKSSSPSSRCRKQMLRLGLVCPSPRSRKSAAKWASLAGHSAADLDSRSLFLGMYEMQSTTIPRR